MTIEEAKTFLDNLKVCIEEHPIVADWLVEIADRKTELTSSKMEQVDKNINVRSKDEPNCHECKHFHENAVMYLDQCDFCFKDCKYEPKDEQTERSE